MEQHESGNMFNSGSPLVHDMQNAYSTALQFLPKPVMEHGTQYSIITQHYEHYA